MKPEQRERGVITSVFSGMDHDHNCLTILLTIDFPGSVQAFGNHMLDAAKYGMLEEYIKTTFGVKSLDDLKGVECYALRPWGKNNELIEGLEAMSGKRFTMTAFDILLAPKGSAVLTRLDRERQRLADTANRALSTALNALSELRNLESGYIEWSDPRVK